ncbi:hypothetical protein NEOLEDRAFT_505223 [Neolentinus lepideus HHB14362 ss-1]|uniref:Uncharacterized protein n=1 Tax=Neolentinus lepideus HHB14362 ss-1 TaxID=1314782 RepID=A0A165RJA0_9AGAM|nr:hypothetical protein NEOLEDRAFT_505223 [Neolentinus lepideus HHB14362 ss-1]
MRERSRMAPFPFALNLNGSLAGKGDSTLQAEVNSSITIKEQLSSAAPDVNSLLSNAKEWFKAHKEIFIVIAIVLLILFLIIILTVAIPHLLVGIVHSLGFGVKGIAKGSLAALYQATFLGGSILKGSVFACMQSVGALGACHG